jgi:hypothetical protein
MADYEGQDFDALMAQQESDASDGGASDTAPAPSSFEGQDFDQLQARYAGQDFDQLAKQYGSAPQPESELQTFGREAAHAVVPAAGGFIAGAGAGALAGSVVPGWGTLGGAIVGGLAGAFGADWAQDKALKAAGFDDTAQRQANLEANPKSAFAGQLAPAAAAMRFDRAAPIVARAISGGLMGGIEAGQELYNEGKVSPGKVAAAAGVGAVLPTPNRVGRVLESAGQGLAARVSGRPGVAASPEAAQAREEAVGEAPATADTIGNPQSAAERSDRVYAKDTPGESPNGDILTTGDVDPTVAAALSQGQGQAPEMVRFYHGHDEGAGPDTGGGRWVTTDPEYARNFRADDGPKQVSYVDIPKGHPDEVRARAWDEIDEAGGTNAVGRYRHVELPEEWAMKMRPLEEATSEKAAAQSRPSPTAPDPLDLAFSGELNAKRASEVAEGLKQQQRDVERQIFGDRADEWRKLHKQSDRAWNNADDAKAKAIDEKISKLEDEVGLTPEDEAWLDGRGWNNQSVPEHWENISRNLDNIEFGRQDALGVVASEVRHLPKHNDWSKMASSEQESVITILSAMNAEKAAGRDPMRFLQDAFRERIRRYGGGADAHEVAQYQMQELADFLRNPINRGEKAVEPQAAAPRQLSAPDEMPAAPQRASDGLTNMGPLPEPVSLNARTKEGEKVTGEVGGGGKEPPSGGPKEPLKPPPPEAKATKEDLETGYWPMIRRAFGAGKGTSFLAAQKNILGKHGEAEQVRQTDQARFTNAMHRLVNDTSPAEQRMLVNWMQGGDYAPHYKPSEGLKDIATQIREGYKRFEETLRSMPEFEKMQFWDNEKYLTGQYKNKSQDEAREFFKDYSRQGGSGSTKKRIFPTDEDARAAGFEPISTNPIERFLLYSEAMSNHIAYKKILAEGKESGYIKYYNPHTVAGAGTPEPYVKGRPPEGWDPLNGLKNAGGAQAYAPREYANAWNNFHGNGLGGNSANWRNFFGGIRRVSNAFTAMELGIATYHAFTTVHERAASAQAVALSEAAAGDLAKAGKTYAKSLAAPFDVKTGKRFQDLYNGVAKDGTPQEMAIVDAAKAANIKPINAKHALDYEMSKAGSYITSYLRGSFKHEMITEWKNLIGENGWKEGMMILPRNMARMMQTIAQPLFEIYIPRMKSAAFFEGVKSWMEAHPDHTVEELHSIAIKIGKSIDNRMGEMAQDNMLMNRTLRDAGTLALRSFSFTLGGPFREIGGGAQSLIRGFAKGENRLSIKSNQYDPRTAYALAFPVAVASMSMLYQFLKTGKGPEEWRDLVYPKTGGEQPGVGKGHAVPERALLPGYHKDIMAYFAHPGREAKNKIAGLWSAIGDQIAGTKMTEVGPVPIVPPNASVGEAALARAKAFGEKATPIFIKTASQDPRLTSKISYPEQLMGLRAPGKWVADPTGQHIADDKRAQREWDSAQKRINRDRATRGLERLPPRERNPNP